MGVYFDADIAGDGRADLVGGNLILYALVHGTARGAGVRELEVGSPDHVLRAGWVSFGDHLSVIGGVDRDYWRAVWWLDFDDAMYTPDPSSSGGAPFALFATRVRWHLPVGSAAHLYVFGA